MPRAGARRAGRGRAGAPGMEPVHEWAHRRPAPPLVPFVAGYQGYRLAGMPPARHAGLPSPFLTLIISLHEPLVIAAHPDPAQDGGSYTTLVGGLHTRPALITHDGAQSGVQISLDPLAARSLLGVPAGRARRARRRRRRRAGRARPARSRADARRALLAGPVRRARPAPARAPARERCRAAATRGRARVATAAGVAGRRPRRDPRRRDGLERPPPGRRAAPRDRALAQGRRARRPVRSARGDCSPARRRAWRMSPQRSGTPTSRISTGTSGSSPARHRAAGWRRRSETSKSRRPSTWQPRSHDRRQTGTWQTPQPRWSGPRSARRTPWA